MQKPYEPPKIESVLTSEQLAREVQYAGGPETIVADGDGD